MALHGNWIDLIILIFLALYAYQGIRRGFLTLIAEMASFLLSFIIGLRFYPQASQLLIANFSLPHSFASAIGFIVVAILAEIIIATFFTALYRRLPFMLFRSSLNHILGLLPGVIDSLILTAFVLSVAVALPISPSLKSDILASRIGSKLISQTHALESSLNQVFGAAVEDTLSFLTIRPGSTQSINLHFRTTDFTIDELSENQMLRLINSERSSHNLHTLTLDPKLQQAARSHSKDMLTRGYFSHVNPDGQNPFDRLRAAGLHYLAAGENLAYAPSVQIAHEGLMNSPGHRANILNPDFGHFGIGVIDAGAYGKMFTQVYTD